MSKSNFKSINIPKRLRLLVLLSLFLSLFVVVNGDTSVPTLVSLSVSATSSSSSSLSGLPLDSDLHLHCEGSSSSSCVMEKSETSENGIQTESESPPFVFIPTKEFQVIPNGVVIPPGLHVRINMQSGVKEAKLLDDDEEEDDHHIKNQNHHDGSDKVHSFSNDLMIVEDHGNDKDNINDCDSCPGPVFTSLPSPDDFPSTPPDSSSSISESDRNSLLRDLAKYFTNSDDISTIRSLINTILLPSSTMDSVLLAMDDLAFLLHQIDNGVDFYTIGGFDMIGEMTDKKHFGEILELWKQNIHSFHHNMTIDGNVKSPSSCPPWIHSHHDNVKDLFSLQSAAFHILGTANSNNQKVKQFANRWKWGMVKHNVENIGETIRITEIFDLINNGRKVSDPSLSSLCYSSASTSPHVSLLSPLYSHLKRGFFSLSSMIRNHNDNFHQFVYHSNSSSFLHNIDDFLKNPHIVSDSDSSKEKGVVEGKINQFLLDLIDEMSTEMHNVTNTLNDPNSTETTHDINTHIRIPLYDDLLSQILRISSDIFLRTHDPKSSTLPLSLSPLVIDSLDTSLNVLLSGHKLKKQISKIRNEEKESVSNNPVDVAESVKENQISDVFPSLRTLQKHLESQLSVKQKKTHLIEKTESQADNALKNDFVLNDDDVSNWEEVFLSDSLEKISQLLVILKEKEANRNIGMKEKISH